MRIYPEAIFPSYRLEHKKYLAKINSLRVVAELLVVSIFDDTKSNFSSAKIVNTKNNLHMENFLPKQQSTYEVGAQHLT